MGDILDGLRWLKRTALNGPKRRLILRNAFITDKSHLNYKPELQEGDSYNNAIIIDKGRLHLYAYDQDGNLTFHTPVSTGRNEGNKTKSGDNKTPVGKFLINNFESNRDPKVFGSNEFWRLYIPGFSGIGIHGDAGHPENIGLPDSHGCIRMPNDSILCFLQKAKPRARQAVYILDEQGNYKKGGRLRKPFGHNLDKVVGNGWMATNDKEMKKKKRKGDNINRLGGIVGINFIGNG